MRNILNGCDIISNKEEKWECPYYNYKFEDDNIIIYFMREDSHYVFIQNLKLKNKNIKTFIWPDIIKLKYNNWEFWVNYNFKFMSNMNNIINESFNKIIIKNKNLVKVKNKWKINFSN